VNNGSMFRDCCIVFANTKSFFVVIKTIQQPEGLLRLYLFYLKMEGSAACTAPGTGKRLAHFEGIRSIVLFFSLSSGFASFG